MNNTFTYNEDDYEIADYTDANGEVDRLFRKVALNIAIIGAVIVTFLGVIGRFSVGSVAVSGNQTVQGAVILPITTPAPIDNDDQDPVAPASQRSVLLDAGHGGFDPGTQGTWTGIYESEINLAITKKLEKVLVENGYKVIMTRTDEKALAPGKEGDMQAREQMILTSGANIFVSIHQNAFEGDHACGPEVYYHPTMPDSETLANCIEGQLKTVVGSKPSRGVKQYEHRLTKFMKYSVLIECGFITNMEEERNLTSDEYQTNIANAIFQGIEDFFDNYYQE